MVVWGFGGLGLWCGGLGFRVVVWGLGVQGGGVGV